MRNLPLGGQRLKENPLAALILGGLISSTLLNLLVMPTLALRFAKFKKEPAPAEAPSPIAGAPIGIVVKTGLL